MLLQWNAPQTPAVGGKRVEHRAVLRLPAVLFETPLAAFALTMLVPLIVLLAW